MARTFYRITLTDPPGEIDFTSRAAQGTAPLDDDPARQRLHEGVSVFATVGQARKRALRYPFLGSYICRLEIPDDAPVQIERTIKNSPGHHTLWGDSAVIRGYVVSVVPV
jgi:hypothetical protein